MLYERVSSIYRVSTPSHTHLDQNKNGGKKITKYKHTARC